MIMPMDHDPSPLRDPRPQGNNAGAPPLVVSMITDNRPRRTRRGNPVVGPDPGTPGSRRLALLAAVLLAGIAIVWQNLGHDRQQRLIRAPAPEAPAAQAAERMPRDMPPNRATPLAAMIECLRKLRREASVTLLGWSLFGLSVMVRFPLGEKKRRHTARLEPESVDTVVLMRSCESRKIRPCLVFAKAVPELLGRHRAGPGAASNRLVASAKSSTCDGATDRPRPARSLVRSR